MIPLYALIYGFVSPNEFYHRTVAHEEPFYRRVADLKQQFRAVLLEDMRPAYQGDAVVSVYQGSAKGMPGVFVRMVYFFSAATAATTGFGDVVPLTTRARILPPSETIIGMILVGLFLNSLTSRGKREGGTS